MSLDHDPVGIQEMRENTLTSSEGLEPSQKLTQICHNGGFVAYCIGQGGEMRHSHWGAVDSWDLIVPATTQSGDLVALMCGTQCLYVIRRLADPWNLYVLVGVGWLQFWIHKAYQYHLLSANQLFDKFNIDTVPPTIARIITVSRRNRMNSSSNDSELKNFIRV